MTFYLGLYLWDTNRDEWQWVATRSDTFIAGEIEGAIKHNTVWHGETWSLKGPVWVQDGARLTIDGGAVVTLAPDAWIGQRQHVGARRRKRRAGGRERHLARTWSSMPARPTAASAGTQPRL